MREFRQAAATRGAGSSVLALGVFASALALGGCATEAPPATAQMAPERCEVTGSRIVSRRNCGADSNVQSVSGDGVRSLMDRPIRPPAAPAGGG